MGRCISRFCGACDASPISVLAPNISVTRPSPLFAVSYNRVREEILVSLEMSMERRSQGNEPTYRPSFTRRQILRQKTLAHVKPHSERLEQANTRSAPTHTSPLNKWTKSYDHAAEYAGGEEVGYFQNPDGVAVRTLSHKCG
jgi:hypothetical protein